MAITTNKIDTDAGLAIVKLEGWRQDKNYDPNLPEDLDKVAFGRNGFGGNGGVLDIVKTYLRRQQAEGLTDGNRLNTDSHVHYAEGSGKDTSKEFDDEYTLNFVTYREDGAACVQFLLDWAVDEPADATTLKDHIVTPLKDMIDSGKELDGDWAVLFTVTNFGTAADNKTYLEKAINNSIQRGHAPDAGVMRAYISTGATNATALMQQVLQQNVASGTILNGQIFGLLQETNPAAASDIAQSALSADIAAGGYLQVNALEYLRVHDSPAWVGVVVANEQKLLSKGEAIDFKSTRLTDLKDKDPQQWASVVKASFDAALKKNPSYTVTADHLAVLDDLIKISPSAAASIMVNTLDAELQAQAPENAALLEKLAEASPRLAQAAAEYRLADYLSRGVAVDTKTNAFLLQLATLSPSSATAWTDSLDAQKAGKPIPLTQAQKNTMTAWSTKMAAMMNEDPTIGTDAQNVSSTSGLTLEAALYMVFLSRAQSMERQLKDQIELVQKKNDQMGKFNEALGSLNKVMASLKGDTKTSDSLSSAGVNSQLITDALAAMKAAGVNPFAPKTLDGGLTKGELDVAINGLKAQVDSLGNNQQIDMLRLQSLTTKRNEAFDVLSTQQKKFSDINSTVTRNM